MSRFPQRWRTQRNAIRNANCKTSWIIKILNAHCAFWFSREHACLSVREPHSALVLANRLEYVNGAKQFLELWYCAFHEVCVRRRVSSPVGLILSIRLYSSVALYCVLEDCRTWFRYRMADGLGRAWLVVCRLVSPHSGSQIKQEDPPNLSI